MRGELSLSTSKRIALGIWSRGSVWVVTAMLIIIATVVSPQFMTATNIMNIMRHASVVGILSIGMLMVIITQGIDLSVGCMAGFAGVLVAGFIQAGMPVWLAVLSCLAIGAAMGAFSGAMVVYGRIAPFIATLAVMTIARGATLLYSNSRSIFVSNPSFIWMGSGFVGGIPAPALIMLVIGALAHFALAKTTYGRSLYAYGGNPQAAYLVGINTRVTVLLAYLLSGLLSFLGGIVLAARMSVGSPMVGPGMELDVIAAVVIGGASLGGGTGSAANTILGVLIITGITNVLNLLGIQSYVQRVVVGFVILGAVLLRVRGERD